jgi:hypothetical protein
MKARKTQLERVRGRLHAIGHITRNECLSQYPAITRLSARISDLKEEGYVFKEGREGRDYGYTLISIKGVSFHTKEKRAEIMKASRIARPTSEWSAAASRRAVRREPRERDRAM